MDSLSSLPTPVTPARIPWHPDRIDVRVTFLVEFLFFTGALVDIGGLHTMAGNLAEAVAWTTFVQAPLLAATLWALRRMSDRWPFTWPIRRGAYARALGAVLVVSMPTVLFTVYVFASPRARALVGYVTSQTVEVITTPLFILLLSLGIQASRMVRWQLARQVARRALSDRLAAARQQAASSELRAFKADLNAHVLLESLTALRTQLLAAPDVAEHLLADLGDHLRRVIARGTRTDVDLADDVAALEPLLQLERTARGGAFTWEIQIPDDLADAAVPQLLTTSVVGALAETRPVRHGPAHLVLTARSARDAEDQFTLCASLRDTASAGARTDDVGGSSESLRALEARLLAVYSTAVAFVEVRHADRVTWNVTLPRDAAGLRSARNAHDAISESPPPARLPFAWWLWRGLVLTGFTAIMWQNALYSLAHYNLTDDQMVRRLHEQMNAFEYVLFLALAMALVRRFPLVSLDGRQTAAPQRALGVYILAGLGITVLRLAMESVAHLGLHVPLLPREDLLVLAYREALRNGFMAPIGVVTVVHFLEFIERRVLDWWRSRHLAQDVTAAMDEQTVHELRALRAELNPHFLGNALHAIGGLVRSAPADAVVLVEQLRTLLARLGTTEDCPATLAAECDQPGLFLAVAKARYGPALTFDVHLAADTHDAAVPTLLLQSLVENAVKHGIAPQGGGTIRIGAHREGRDLVVTVADNGAGLKAHGHAPGIGLAHTRERLSGRYGARATVTLVANDPTGALVTVRLPFTHAA